MKIICSTFSARPGPNGLFEIDVRDPQPADLLPRIFTHAEAAERLGISKRHLNKLVKKYRIRPLPDLPKRWRETDLLKLTEPVAVIAAPSADHCFASVQKPMSGESAPAATSAQPKRKTHLIV